MLISETVRPVVVPNPKIRRFSTTFGYIQPLFEKTCGKCHSGQGAKAGLSLDTLEEVLKGGTKGKMVVPGDSAKSRLIIELTTVGKPASSPIRSSRRTTSRSG